jgi:hypothetical protein
MTIALTPALPVAGRDDDYTRSAPRGSKAFARQTIALHTAIFVGGGGTITKGECRDEH